LNSDKLRGARLWIYLLGVAVGRCAGRMRVDAAAQQEHLDAISERNEQLQLENLRFKSNGPKLYKAVVRFSSSFHTMRGGVSTNLKQLGASFSRDLFEETESEFKRVGFNEVTCFSVSLHLSTTTSTISPLRGIGSRCARVHSGCCLRTADCEHIHFLVEPPFCTTVFKSSRRLFSVGLLSVCVCGKADRQTETEKKRGGGGGGRPARSLVTSGLLLHSARTGI
jgi:hypothetical protein